MVSLSVELFIGGCRALALVEELSAVTGVMQKHPDAEVRLIGPELVLKTRRTRHGMDRHRLWWNGVLVLDGDAGNGLVGIRTYVPGDWAMQISCLVLSWRTGLAAPRQRVDSDRRIVRPVPGRHVPIRRTERSVHRSETIAIAAAIVARGRVRPTDPSIRVQWLNGHVVAVCIAGPVALMSVHARDGELELTVSIDRVWPHHVVKSDRIDASLLLRRLSASTTTQPHDEAAFRAFCERAA